MKKTLSLILCLLILTGMAPAQAKTVKEWLEGYDTGEVWFGEDFHYDITDEEAEREKKARINQQTVEVANTVVEKQMRIVQEIASLLGETAAETKIALTKLKESIGDE